MNQDQWDRNTLQEEEEKALSTTTSQTPLPQEKHNKRPREEISSPVTEISAKEFISYPKRHRTGPKTFTILQEEGHDTIVMVGT